MAQAFWLGWPGPTDWCTGDVMPLNNQWDKRFSLVYEIPVNSSKCPKEIWEIPCSNWNSLKVYELAREVELGESRTHQCLSCEAYIIHLKQRKSHKEFLGLKWIICTVKKTFLVQIIKGKSYRQTNLRINFQRILKWF